MIKEVSIDIYRKTFSSDQHFFISEKFINLVENKTERVIRLVDDQNSSMGLILGVENGELHSPFSAPFGGFHYTHEYINYEQIYNFIERLKTFTAEHYKAVHIVIPPDIYQNNMNAKLTNALIRAGYKMNTPDIHHWADLKEFDNNWIKPSVGSRCRRAARNGLSFELAQDKASKLSSYNIVKMNRLMQGRKIHIDFNDLVHVEKLIPIDYFSIKNKNGEGVAAAIMYRAHDKIVQCVFLGDNLKERKTGATDLLLLNLYMHYKKLNIRIIDFGTSSLNGTPNPGVIRFKEIHNCKTSLRYSFSWFKSMS